jgi:hypothetical protein
LLFHGVIKIFEKILLGRKAKAFLQRRLLKKDKKVVLAMTTLANFHEDLNQFCCTSLQSLPQPDFVAHFDKMTLGIPDTSEQRQKLEWNRRRRILEDIVWVRARP